VSRLRILDFDIENRPLSYLGQDFTTADITAIAWGWTDRPKSIECWVQTKETYQSVDLMLGQFRKMWDEADIVTGHYILMHDLGHINGALIEFGFPQLTQKLVSDTKVHLRKFTGLSKSQENLGELFKLEAQKFHMNTPRWREANRLTPEGIELTEQRVKDDVRMHMQLRKVLIEKDMLKPPKIWRP
jgi:hypothetical protein